LDFTLKVAPACFDQLCIRHIILCLALEPAKHALEIVCHKITANPAPTSFICCLASRAAPGKRVHDQAPWVSGHPNEELRDLSLPHNSLQHNLANSIQEKSHADLDVSLCVSGLRVWPEYLIFGIWLRLIA
jgi:hypothetical protein